MAKNQSRSKARERRHKRVRSHISGTPERPRLSIYRSLSEIYAQIIDDKAGRTLASASTLDHELRSNMDGLKKSDQARKIGQALAERARAKGIKQIVFDRGGYHYIGRVKALAEGAREGGLEF